MIDKQLIKNLETRCRESSGTPNRMVPLNEIKPYGSYTSGAYEFQVDSLSKLYLRHCPL